MGLENVPAWRGGSVTAGFENRPHGAPEAPRRTTRRGLCLIDDIGLQALRQAATFRARSIVYLAGVRVDDLFVIRSGVTKSIRLLPDGRRQICGFASRGDVIGLTSAEQLACCTVQAITKVEAWRLDRERFLRLLPTRPDLALKLLDAAIDKAALLEDHLVLLGRQRAKERVAWFLLKMEEKLGEGGHGETFVLPMPRADIADYLGLTIETVSRSVAELRDAGLIDTARHGPVRLLDRDALYGIAGLHCAAPSGP